ncbi:hypothetical protein ACYULU_16410, partial [Breznakiellaceae bacterium SP9]
GTGKFTKIGSSSNNIITGDSDSFPNTATGGGSAVYVTTGGIYARTAGFNTPNNANYPYDAAQ